MQRPRGRRESMDDLGKNKRGKPIWLERRGKWRVLEDEAEEVVKVR